jgi:hypothetical protein
MIEQEELGSSQHKEGGLNPLTTVDSEKISEVASWDLFIR